MDGAGRGGRDLGTVTARVALVRDWLGEVLGGTSSPEITTASQDASFRHYFRVHNGEDVYIVMDASSQAIGQESWIDVRARLEGSRPDGTGAPCLRSRAGSAACLRLRDPALPGRTDPIAGRRAL